MLDDTSSNYVILAIMLGYLSLVYVCCSKNYEDRGTDPDPPELWVPIGYYNGDTLYEQSFASGKKAWCFKDKDMVVIQRVTNEPVQTIQRIQTRSQTKRFKK